MDYSSEHFKKLLDAMGEILGALDRCEQNEDSSVVDELTEEIEQNARTAYAAALAAEVDSKKKPANSEFERGRLAEQDRLATELFERGGFATLQLNSNPDGLPRMKFVDPGDTQQVGVVRIGSGIMLVKNPA